MNGYFDGHADTVFRIYDEGGSLNSEKFHIKASDLKKYDKYIQVFAAFIDKKDCKLPLIKHALTLIDKYYAEIEKNNITPILTKEDLINANKTGGASSILSLEGGEMLDGSLSVLSAYYRLGVRLITLTWNYSNELADGILEKRGGGLTNFGYTAVKAMENMGILVDVSHLSEKGFWDVAKCTERPFIASHSCVKSICSHPRNLNDEQIKEMIKRKCVIGINFYPAFLDNSGICGFEKIAEHIEYILNMGGEDTVALGSDFDGVDSLPDGISGICDMHKIPEYLKERGISDKVINKICFESLYNLFYDTLK